MSASQKLIKKRQYVRQKITNSANKVNLSLSTLTADEKLILNHRLQSLQTEVDNLNSKIFDNL